MVATVAQVGDLIRRKQYSNELEKAQRRILQLEAEIERLTQPGNMILLIRETRQRVKDDKRSVGEVAALVDVSQPTLYRYLKGDGKCFFLINRLANLYGIQYTVSNFDHKSIPDNEWKV